jgi:hypothetical protein
MKKLGIGISDFKKLIEGNYIYVDKTKYIYKLIEEGGNYYFLSRPRRFGKSLLLSTIRYLFENHKDLFKNLYIYDKWNWDEVYPVLRISFAKDIKNKDELKDKIYHELEKNYLKHSLEIPTRIKDNTLLFEKLIIKLSKTIHKKIVILVDEYDKPILDLIEDIKQAEEVRKELKAFYSILKDLDEFIKFVFITGVSKFSKVSLFSGLNQLEDISLNKEFGNICGYTQQELESYFNDYLKDLNLDQIKEWYNGYYFLKDTLYNPFDILLYLKNKTFRNYWYETGKTEFLFKLLKNQNYELPYLNKLYYTSDILDKFDLEYISIEALMFQTGYLTIKDLQTIESEEMYILNYPNREVQQSFNRDLLFYITQTYHIDKTYNFKLALINQNISLFKNQLEIFFNSISYHILKNEFVYQAAIFGLIYSTGFNIILEDTTSKGRIDLTIIVNNSIVYIIEFKVIQNTQDKGKALNQILQKEYFKKYLNYDKIYIIGIDFDKNKKHISNFEYKQIK